MHHMRKKCATYASEWEKWDMTHSDAYVAHHVRIWCATYASYAQKMRNICIWMSHVPCIHLNELCSKYGWIAPHLWVDHVCCASPTLFRCCTRHLCCSMLQYVAVWTSVSLCVAVCCSVLQYVAVCCSVNQCVTVCCSVLQCVAVCCSMLQCEPVCCSVLQCVAVCCSVLLCD